MGLCGIMNGYRPDDKTLPNGVETEDVQQFVHDWGIQSVMVNFIDHTEACDLVNQQMAENVCSQLNKGRRSLHV